MPKRFCLIALILLLSACATPGYQDYILQNNFEGVKYMRQSGADINTLGYWGTPLATAARTNNVRVARYLLDNGADVNHGNAEGYESKSPLHAAAANGSVDVARLLLANGADTTIRNSKNLTPLQLARTKNQQGMVDLLNEYERQESAWQETIETDTYEAYGLFLDSYPQSAYRTEAETRRQALKAEYDEVQQLKQQQLAALEASLPPSVRRDKLMVQLSQHLKQSDFEQALAIFPKLEQLPVDTDPSLKFFYGEALLKTGNPARALKKFYEYITEQGSEARHYARALVLINEAESQL